MAAKSEKICGGLILLIPSEVVNLQPKLRKMDYKWNCTFAPDNKRRTIRYQVIT